MLSMGMGGPRLECVGERADEIVDHRAGQGHGALPSLVLCVSVWSGNHLSTVQAYNNGEGGKPRGYLEVFREMHGALFWLQTPNRHESVWVCIIVSHIVAG